MNEKKYFIDDRVMIPEEIKKMTKEERLAEIKKLEAEASAEKNRVSNMSNHKKEICSMDDTSKNRKEIKQIIDNMFIINEK